MDSNRARQSQPANQSNRFHYPSYKPSQSSKPSQQPSQYEEYAQQFPPHPSVRVPPNVKLSARNVPAGVGVAIPPVKPRQEPRPQQRTTSSGVLVQDFKFPQAPPIPQSRISGRSRDPSQSPGRRNNMHESYMSSVLGDFADPRTTPGSKQRSFTASRRYSGSVYAESEAIPADERFVAGPHSPLSTRSNSPVNEFPQVMRQASIGKRAKPAVTTIKTQNMHPSNDRQDNRFAPKSPARVATVTAFSAAVAAGAGDRSATPNKEPGSRSYTPVRMPFENSPPGSPSADREYLKTPISPQTTISSKMLGQAPPTAESQESTNQLLGLGIGQPAMSDKIPTHRRPPKLDMNAVREAQDRGSTTSLSDLIRRATKLAANLDRGKTASRLGMLDMFGSTEKLSNNHRHSTMSDMISAFPAPAMGTPTNRRDTMWPNGEKGEAYASTSNLSKSVQQKTRRRCCGMSLPVFILVLVVIVILIAAAVLIPIFLILVPRQRNNSSGIDLSNCAASNPCQNGGTSIVSNNACACVCSNGFIGSQCGTVGNADDCASVTLSDGSTEYNNATIGLSLLPTLTDASSQFDIPLNVSTILSIFSTNNVSCASENSLVDFNSSIFGQGAKVKRFTILQDLEPPSVDSISLALAKRFIMVPGLEPQQDAPLFPGNPHAPQVTGRALPEDASVLERRQDDVEVGTTNGIVFQASSTDRGPSATSAPEGESTETATSTSSATSSEETASASETADGTADAEPSSTVSEKQIEFARVIVLFVLQESKATSFAVNAQQQMESFFAQSSSQSSNSTVEVGADDLTFTVDFEQFTLEYTNGTSISGS